jgi:hypothetical protein
VTVTGDINIFRWYRSMSGDDEAALRALQKAKELDPSNAQRRVAIAVHLYTRLSAVSEALGDLPAAQRYLQARCGFRHGNRAIGPDSICFCSATRHKENRTPIACG